MVVGAVDSANQSTLSQLLFKFVYKPPRQVFSRGIIHPVWAGLPAGGELPHRTGPSILQLTSCKMVRHVADFLKTSFSLGGDNRFFNIWKELLGTSFALQSFSWPKLFFPWHIDLKKKFRSPSFFWFKYLSGLKEISFQNLQTNYYQKRGRKEILPRKELSWEMSLRFSDPPGFSLRRDGSSGIKTWFWNCDPGHIV